MSNVSELTITNWLGDFYEAHPTKYDRRELATNLITRGGIVPKYRDATTTRFHLSVLWALDRPSPKVREVATKLWRLPPAATEFAGQLAIVFQHGNRDTPSQLQNYEYLRLTIGTLPAKAEFNHRFEGKLSPAASPSIEGIKAPYIESSVMLTLLNSRMLSADAQDFTLGEPAVDETAVMMHSATAHIGEDEAYAAATTEVADYRVLIGDRLVEAFMGDLDEHVEADMSEALCLLQAPAVTV